MPKRRRCSPSHRRWQGSREAARGAGESPEEVAAIEHEILPKMIVAGFATVTITSVIVTSILAGHIGRS
jgi:hypothetical protein